MSDSVWIYRIYDITDEINLKSVEQILAPEKPTSRLRLSRVQPKSIHIDNPPVTVELSNTDISIAEHRYPGTVLARIFDLGVISIVLKVELPPGTSYEELKDLSVYLHNTDKFEPIFQNFLEIVKKSLNINVSTSREQYVEDFIIYFFRNWDFTLDPAPILLGEKEPLSEQVRRDTLKNSFSYGTGDLTIITWDSALVYDSEGSTDVPDLLEFATSQLLELRYYDDLLSHELDRMHDAIAWADKGGWWARLRQYRRIMKNLMEVVLDITEITEKIQKQLTVTEDVFYARVYGSALTIFRTREWTDIIQHKVTLIQRNYSMLSDEVINHRSLLLELAIIALFLFEIIIGLIQMVK
ncbi:MAG: hypothetical protein ACYC21_06310 [Eubacteriales bacterium]